MLGNIFHPFFLDAGIIIEVEFSIYDFVVFRAAACIVALRDSPCTVSAVLRSILVRIFFESIEVVLRREKPGCSFVGSGELRFSFGWFFVFEEGDGIVSTYGVGTEESGIDGFNRESVRECEE